MTQPPLVLGEKVWCPRCGEYVKVVRVAGAAKIVDVDRRTVYNYVKKNKVYAVRVAGSTLRVCSHCLLRENGEQSANGHHEFSRPAERAVQT
jgi:sarcosine oxidase delta subunit